MPSKPYIVAELSCNHLGQLNRAIKLVEAAKAAGADAVKLQCWYPGRMCVDRQYQIMAGTWQGSRLYDLYQAAFTPWEWFPRLFEYAKNIGIECFSSVFDVEALAFLEALGCPRYKIASFEITDLPLIRAVAATGKPIVISTGMATWNEIITAHAAAGGHPVTFLKCTSSYPASPSQLNLLTITDGPLRAYGRVGLSDHTLGHTAAVVATVLGATMIEKHLTLSRSDGGPDAGFSVEPHELKALVDACRDAAAALGVVRYGPTEAEKPSLIFRRSLYVRHAIPQGAVLTNEVIAESIVSSRPALGLPPDYPILGRRVLRDLPAGTPLREADLAG